VRKTLIRLVLRGSPLRRSGETFDLLFASADERLRAARVFGRHGYAVTSGDSSLGMAITLPKVRWARVRLTGAGSVR